MQARACGVVCVWGGGGAAWQMMMRTACGRWPRACMHVCTRRPAGTHGTYCMAGQGMAGQPAVLAPAVKRADAASIHFIL